MAAVLQCLVPCTTRSLLEEKRSYAVLRGARVTRAVAVQAPEGGRVFDEGSVLVLAEGRAALGRVEEVFGPVAAPLYALRYAGPGELPPAAAPGAQVPARAAPGGRPHALRTALALLRSALCSAGGGWRGCEGCAPVRQAAAFVWRPGPRLALGPGASLTGWDSRRASGLETRSPIRFQRALSGGCPAEVR